MKIHDLIALARPWQWSKNGILFAGLIFSRHLLDVDYTLRTLAAFGVFCLGSSVVYIVNDILDLDRDRVHPVKRERPLPAGRIRPATAWGLAGVLLALSLGGAFPLGPWFVFTLAAFLISNFAYSITLKNVVILDVMMIAISFVIRAIAGVMALRPLDPGIVLSPWLLVCTLFLALFLGFGKRRNELNLLDHDAAGHRTTLGEYSREFLDQLITIVTAATIIAYAIYTITPATLTKFHSPNLVFTIPFVAYGVFRYLYLIRIRDGGGSPSRTLYRDIPLLLTTLGWLVTVVVVIYAGR